MRSPAIGLIGVLTEIAPVQPPWVDCGDCNAFADALLTWHLIGHGGLVLFDDYEWGLEKPITERPKLGIDLALKHLEGQFQLAFRDWQNPDSENHLRRRHALLGGGRRNQIDVVAQIKG